MGLIGEIHEELSAAHNANMLENILLEAIKLEPVDNYKDCDGDTAFFL